MRLSVCCHEEVEATAAREEGTSFYVCLKCRRACDTCVNISLADAMARTALDSTLTRWRHRQSGEPLVAVAVKDDDGVRMVLPIKHAPSMLGDAYRAAHRCDWLPERSFLRMYEVVE